LVPKSRGPIDRPAAGGLNDLRFGALAFVRIVRLPSPAALANGRGRLRLSIRDNTEVWFSDESWLKPCS
jgi:hypothetical protein